MMDRIGIELNKKNIFITYNLSNLNNQNKLFYKINFTKKLNRTI